jgi:cytochrome c
MVPERENRMKVMGILVTAAVLWAGAACAASVPLSLEIERGRTLAQRNCATCHAIGRTGSSPYSPAPPFRTLHERYDVEALAEALAEGIVVGHGGARQMPQFVLTPAQIDDLLAYLKSLEAP